jgi:hypothetical protein
MQIGGYISVKDYLDSLGEVISIPSGWEELTWSEERQANTWITFTPAEGVWPKVGDEYAYFLLDNAESSEFFQGIYTPLCDAEGSFAKMPDGTYTRPIDNQGVKIPGDDSPVKDSFTLEELHYYFGEASDGFLG